MQGDLFDPLIKQNVKGFDLVVSNPPFLKSSTIDKKNRESFYKLTPRIDIDGGTDGLLFHRRIIERAHRFLSREGVLVIEISVNMRFDRLPITA